MNLVTRHISKLKIVGTSLIAIALTGTAVLGSPGDAIYKNSNSGLCMGVDGASTDSGAAVMQFRCDNSLNQTWNGYSAIEGVNVINQKSQMCLGVSGGGGVSGADLKQFTCDTIPTNNQLWSLKRLEDGTYRLRNNNGLCAGVDGASRAVGARIKQFPCDNRANQRWDLLR